MNLLQKSKHEFNNYLTLIFGLADLWLNQLPEYDAATNTIRISLDDVKEIWQAGDKLRKMLKNITFLINQDEEDESNADSQ